jgi:hypothetical protein
VVTGAQVAPLIQGRGVCSMRQGSAGATCQRPATLLRVADRDQDGQQPKSIVVGVERLYLVQERL